MRTGDLPQVSDQTRDFAKALRREMTNAERKLWSKLRNQQLGVKFRRQEPLGRFIVDFFCKEAKLIVELDGGQHWEEQNVFKDAERTKELEGLGFRVVRFSDRDVMVNVEGVVGEIMKLLGR